MKKINLFVSLIFISTTAFSETRSLFEGAYLGIDLSRVMSSDEKGTESSNGVSSGYTLDTDYDGSLSLGLKGGYNWLVSDKIVFGFDASFHKYDNDKHNATWYVNGVIDTRYPESAKIDNRFDLKAKLGYLFDNSKSLVYLTSGYSRIDIERTDQVTVGVGGGQFNGTATNKKHSDGWVIGLGGEHFISDNLSMSAEYLYTNYGSETVDTGYMYGAGAQQKYDYDDQTLRIGLAYWFK